MSWFWVSLDWLNWFGETYEKALVSLGTIALALFTLGLWLSTWALWRVTNASLKLARQEFIATHRPQVIVRSIDIPQLNEQGYWCTKVTVVNTGDTPATITKFGGDMPWRGPTGNWFDPPIGASAQPIAPIRLVSGQAHAFAFQGRLTNEEFRRIHGQATIWCAGNLEYLDDSGLKRATGFRRYWDQGQGLIIPSPFGEEYVD